MFCVCGEGFIGNVLCEFERNRKRRRIRFWMRLRMRCCLHGHVGRHRNWKLVFIGTVAFIAFTWIVRDCSGTGASVIDLTFETRASGQHVFRTIFYSDFPNPYFDFCTFTLVRACMAWIRRRQFSFWPTLTFLWGILESSHENSKLSPAVTYLRSPQNCTQIWLKLHWQLLQGPNWMSLPSAGFFLLADISDIPPRAYVSKGLYLYLLAAKCADTGQCRSRVSCWKFVLVPKQCPRLRPIIWYLFCCARCLGSQDIVQNHTHIHTYIDTYIHTYIHTYMTQLRVSSDIDCLTPASRLRRSASVWITTIVDDVTSRRRRLSCLRRQNCANGRRSLTPTIHTNQKIARKSGPCWDWCYGYFLPRKTDEDMAPKWGPTFGPHLENGPDIAWVFRTNVPTLPRLSVHKHTHTQTHKHKQTNTQTQQHTHTIIQTHTCTFI